MNVTVIGVGYVGLSNAVLLARHNEVQALDIAEEKVNLINGGKSPIVDKEIEEYLANKKLMLEATTDAKKALKNAEFVIISTPTNYDPEKNYFDTSSVENAIENVLKYSKDAVIFIKSTVPVGYTKKMREKYHTDRILFSLEFLREGRALYDNLYPSRIIVGCPLENDSLVSRAREFADLLAAWVVKENIPKLLMDSQKRKT